MLIAITQDADPFVIWRVYWKKHKSDVERRLYMCRRNTCRFYFCSGSLSVI